jgi:hypothetical protein
LSLVGGCTATFSLVGGYTATLSLEGGYTATLSLEGGGSQHWRCQLCAWMILC